MTTRRLILLTAAGWACYTWGHLVGHERAEGKRPYVGRLFR